MTTDDRELLIRIDERVERMEKYLLGNGQPGLCDKHGARLTLIEATQEQTNGAIKVMKWAIGVLVAAVAAVGAFLKG